ncbi:DNA mismatch repair protein MutL [Lachnospiraceae bacterium NE2001]|nr:DNA mismatch repair protein MutL [Lachnospiraceae bacterium NE2001]
MIKILDQHTIDKIAAGEVIERPSSVVKELVENSIDSHATRITVEITDGGTSMIRVTDNGDGIEESDVRKAFYSHATSKLDNVDDLLAISSLGFRGEALSTIAAISRVEMITKTRSSLTGYKYAIEGGKETEFTEIGAPDGTTIIARDIFFNTPARLKFLKTNMTEGSYINDMMTHIALSNPDVAIKLISGGKTIIDTQGDGRLKETIYSLYGKEIARGLLDVDYADENIKISGYIGKPFLSKGNRGFENYFVNKRFIKSPVVNRAIEEAYKTHIMQHKFPYTALFIELPTYMVDVNVHPAKREFRFDDEKGLFHAVFHAVQDALADKVMIPDAEAEYVAKPVIKEEPEKPAYVTPVKAPSTEPAISKTVDTLDMTESKNTSYVSDNHSNGFNKGGKGSFSILESLLPKDYLDKLSEKSNTESNNIASTETIDTSSSDKLTETVDTSSSGVSSKNLGYESSPKSDKTTYVQTEMSETRFLSEEARGHHKIIGQVFKTYWITEYDGCLYLMDQHAAHEKVNYETFLAEFKERKIHSQNMFPPEIVSLTNAEKQAVLENTEYLREYGFEIEEFGGNDVKLSAMPANLIGLDGREVFTELVAYLTDGVSEVTEDIFVRKLATMGCKAAIKGNQEISEYEIRDLIEKLMKLKDPYTCPHGRPTLIKMTKEELDKKFKRIVE